MGEYARRKSDNVEIKVGTCRSMYYIRYEDREKVKQVSWSCNPATEANLLWRLPVESEDNILIGDYSYPMPEINLGNYKFDGGHNCKSDSNKLYSLYGVKNLPNDLRPF